MGRERGYQRHPRFTKRLEARFHAAGLSFTGILSNLSENGLFIRTNRGFAPDTVINIELLIPDRKISFLKGIVRRTIKTPMSSLKNGMGIELIEKDDIYIDFVKSFTEETETKTDRDTERETVTEKSSAPEFHIISCPNCGIKNKVSHAKLSLGPKCGRCGTPLTIDIP
jgi:hypothetical protein